MLNNSIGITGSMRRKEIFARDYAHDVVTYIHIPSINHRVIMSESMQKGRGARTMKSTQQQGERPQ